MADNNEPTILDFETGSFKVFNSGVFKLSEEILNSYPQYERLRFELRNQVDETPYSGPIEPNFPENITTEFTINTSETTDVDNSPLLCLVNIDDNLIYWSCNCYGIVVPEEITIISPAEGQVISLNEQVPLIADVKPKGYDTEKYKVEWEVPEFDGSCKKTHDEQLLVLSDCDEAVIRAYISPLLPNGNRVETTNKVRFGCKIEKIELVDIKDRYFVGQIIASERNVKLTPVNAVAKDLSWSFDEQLIEITKDGDLKAKASGTSTIQVSSGGIDSKVITVHIPDILVINCEQTEIKANESIKMDCLFNSDAIPSSYKWECSNSDAAVFENPDKESTMLIAKAPDVVVITLTITDMAGTKYVSRHTLNIIEVPVTDVVLTPNTKQELKKGDTMTFTANCLPVDATDKSIEWLVAGDSVKDLKQDSTSIELIGLKRGNSTVKAMHGGIEATCDIVVKEQPIVVIPTTFDVDEGKSATIKPNIDYGCANKGLLTWQMLKISQTKNLSDKWENCEKDKSYKVTTDGSLSIPKIEYKDNGTRYRCLASNSLYKDIASNVMKLHVIAKSPTTTKVQPFAIVSVAKGANCKLESNITANQATWKWEFAMYNFETLNFQNWVTFCTNVETTQFAPPRIGFYSLRCTASNLSGTITEILNPISVVPNDSFRVLLHSKYVLSSDDFGEFIYPKKEYKVKSQLGTATKWHITNKGTVKRWFWIDHMNQEIGPCDNHMYFAAASNFYNGAKGRSLVCVINYNNTTYFSNPSEIIVCNKKLYILPEGSTNVNGNTLNLLVDKSQIFNFYSVNNTLTSKKINCDISMCESFDSSIATVEPIKNSAKNVTGFRITGVSAGEVKVYLTAYKSDLSYGFTKLINVIVK